MSTTKLVAPSTTQAGSTITTGYGNYTVAADLTVTVDSRAVEALIGAGYVLFSGNLPLGEGLIGGSHAVTSGEATAHTASIVTGLSSIVSYQVMILRAGIQLPLATITKSAGTITVADNSTDYVLTAADVILWVALGVA